jgi:polysaccharide chain length determinant protein (PEP-CTERM system associated)
LAKLPKGDFMNQNTLKITPEFVLELVVRRRWIILASFCIALIAGIYLAIALPRVYEAKTLILIEPQGVPQQFVQSIVSIDPGERINTLSQQILSRTSLEKIITSFKLFSKPGQKGLFLEEKVDQLRKQITIDVITDRRRRETDAFSIAFKGKDPKKVAAVANALASNFIDENLKIRESQAFGTSEFLDAELVSRRKRLEEVEEKIKEYRKAYMGELPEQLETNLRILDRLQVNFNDQQQNVRDGRERLAQLNNQTSSRNQSVVVIGNEAMANNGATSLEDLKAQLETLKSRYTEKHPDILRIEKQIAELEAKQSSDSADNNTNQPMAANSNLAPRLRQQINDAQREIQLAESEIESLKKQIAEYQQRVENTPKREQELLSLKRDYQNLQTSYDSLLSRKLEADVSVNMERKQKGEQFRIIDSARVPQMPVAPDMRKLFLVVVAAGLGLGGGIAYLTEYLGPSFRKPDDLESFYELPVLTSIPRIYEAKQLLLRKLNFAFSIAAAVVAVGLLGVFSAICITGPEQVIGALLKIL